MDLLAPEEDTDLEGEDRTDLSISDVGASTPSTEESKTVLISPAFTENGETPPPPLLSHYNDAHELGNICVAANSPRIASTNISPSPEP